MLNRFIGIIYIYIFIFISFFFSFFFFKIEEFNIECFLVIFYLVEINLFIWILTYNCNSFYIKKCFKLFGFIFLVFLYIFLYFFIFEGIILKIPLEFIEIFFIFLNILFEVGYMMIIFMK